MTYVLGTSFIIDLMHSDGDAVREAKELVAGEPRNCSRDPFSIEGCSLQRLDEVFHNA
ncbi:MAG: hypothetical protein KIS30_05375 [Thermoplasmata archaeon]|nr:hypothetical protein [Candidatus Sysuiplasma acidicola]MBX8638363.1 hypothetical protein [Candidatus Sysuiplasma acidicola]MBX8646173.1 hypothetical protein [Candidatus Sysuiplasma acidicola]